MSASDMANAAYQAGFRGDALVTAIAVSLAEDPASDPNAECNSCLGVLEDSCGYWQINILAHPEYSKPSIFTPSVNAGAAYSISSGGTNFGAWSTFNGGQYLAHIPQAQQLATGVASGAPQIPSPALNPKASAAVVPAAVSGFPWWILPAGLVVYAVVS